MTLNAARTRARRLAVAPLVAILSAVTLFPLLYILVVSLTNFAADNPNPGFVGLDNYTRLLTSEVYWQTLARTVGFVVLAVASQVAFGLAIAVAMSSIKKGDAVLRAVILMPMAAAPIAMLYNWRQILNASYGPVNAILDAVGLPAPDWLGQTSTAMFSLLVVDGWQWTPFVFIILAGGLATIPHDVLEAAAVDGAGPGRQFLFVTLPLLMPYVTVAVLFRTVDALKTFDSVQILTSGGPGSSTTMLNFSIFKESISYLEFGRASASAFLFIVVCTLLSRALLGAIGRETRT